MSKARPPNLVVNVHGSFKQKEAGRLTAPAKLPVAK
jgi:hypothetical protein